MKELICQYCGSQRKNINSFKNHERLCPSNPDRKYINGMTGKKGSNQYIDAAKHNLPAPTYEISDETRQRLSKARIGKKMSNETKEKLSKIRVEQLNHNAFYSKRTKYKGIMLDSSYELTVAKSLDEHNIEWTRPKSIIWNDNGQLRRYIPDFYLPAYNVFLDPKNDFLITKDKRKISLAEEYNSVRIIILDKDNLEWDNILTKINGSETW
tara:strand:+ start:83 stop:715 length:633 start_codon:yes stop_codon:yes gene_type:complete